MVGRHGSPIGAILIGTVLLSGCGANWEPVSVASPRTFGESTVLEFQVREQLVRLHGVRLGHDSLSGIPWLDHLSCDTCRIHYALADISQPRVGNPGRTAWSLVVPVAVVFTLFEALHILYCGGTGECT